MYIFYAYAKLEKNATNLVVDFPSDATNKTIAFKYEGTLTSVDWGDGETSSDESSHEYKNAGQYVINIYGNFANFSLSNFILYSDGNKYVKNIKLKEEITSIGDWAFFDIASLTLINIPNSVTSIGRGAFENCLELVSINIPNSVTSIGQYTFSNCPALSSIFVDSENRKYDSRNDCNAIIETSSNALIYGCKNTIIPSTVTSIGDSAFLNCSSLTSITIPSSVTSIENNAFDKCSSLASINIPNSVTSIGGMAFSSCFSITSIFIPISVTTMGQKVFNSCSGLAEIRCQAPSQPSGWDNGWRDDVDPIKIKWNQPN